MRFRFTGSTGSSAQFAIELPARRSRKRTRHMRRQFHRKLLAEARDAELMKVEIQRDNDTGVDFMRFDSRSKKTGRLTMRVSTLPMSYGVAACDARMKILLYEK